MTEIAVIGAGYVGLVSGVCFSALGLRVHFVESDPAKLEKLQAGHVPFHEPGLEELMRGALRRNALSFHASTAELLGKAKPKAIFICVGTPSRPDGSCDTSYVEKAFDGILAAKPENCVVVLKSTVPVGMARRLIDAARAKNVRLPVVNNPEFLREGTAVIDFMRPERVVLGGEDDEAVSAVRSLYEPLLRNGHPLLVVNHETAELAKLAANLMLASRIGIVNQISRLAAVVGGDIKQIETVLKTDSRIGPKYLYAGLGYGGSCFPKDVKNFVQTCRGYGIDASIAEAIDRQNDEQKLFFLPELERRYPDASKAPIALLGVAFKPDTDDIRESPALALTTALAKRGHPLHVYDPAALGNYRAWLKSEGLGNKIEFHTSEGNALRAAKVAILVTEWKQFQSLDFGDLKEHFKGELVLDGKNIFNPGRIRSMGYEYLGVGRR